MGISKLRQASQVTMTTVSGPAGTYPYMAPEMFVPGYRGTGVDIYALGCLYIELFGQKMVWPGLFSSYLRMMNRHKLPMIIF